MNYYEPFTKTAFSYFLNSSIRCHFVKYFFASRKLRYFHLHALCLGLICFFSSQMNGQAIMVKDINKGSASTEIGGVESVNGKILFYATDSLHGGELWTTDGTDAGTQLFLDIYPGTNSSKIEFQLNLGNILYFKADDGVHGPELWVTDGSVSGTHLLKDIYPGPSFIMFYGGMTLVNGIVYFMAYDNVHYYELWRTDGTDSGTWMVKDIAPGYQITDNNYTFNSIEYNNKLLFAYDDLTHGKELWITDGTDTGTKLLKDINTGQASSIQSKLIKFKDKVYFVANDTVYGSEIWVSDGTTNGTHLFKELIEGVNSRIIYYLVPTDDLLFFNCSDTTHGNEIWTSDGTVDNTKILKDIRTGFRGSDIEYLYIWKNELYFSAVQENTGRELWKSDGTEAGTFLLKDIYINASSIPHDFIGGNEKLYFIASDRKGTEIWESNGDSTNTKLLKDINPSVFMSDHHPVIKKIINDTLYFVAYNKTNGYELWRTTVLKTGLNSMVHQNKFSVYPNPGKGLYQITGDEWRKISVYDFSGQMVFQTEYDTYSNLDLSKCPDGIYLILIEDATGSQTWLKLLKNN